MVRARYPRLPIGSNRRTEIGDYLGVSRKSMSLWCRGLQRPSHETLLRLIDYLHLDPATGETLQLAYGYVPAGLRLLALDHPASLIEALRALWSDLDTPLFSRRWNDFRDLGEDPDPEVEASVVNGLVGSPMPGRVSRLPRAPRKLGVLKSSR